MGYFQIYWYVVWWPHCAQNSLHSSLHSSIHLCRWTLLKIITTWFNLWLICWMPSYLSLCMFCSTQMYNLSALWRAFPWHLWHNRHVWFVTIKICAASSQQSKPRPTKSSCLFLLKLCIYMCAWKLYGLWQNLIFSRDVFQPSDPKTIGRWRPCSMRLCLWMKQRFEIGFEKQQPLWRSGPSMLELVEILIFWVGHSKGAQEREREREHITSVINHKLIRLWHRLYYIIQIWMSSYQD